VLEQTKNAKQSLFRADDHTIPHSTTTTQNITIINGAYAFINFFDVKSAITAKRATKGVKVGDITLTVRYRV
jgi:hypothetical protein